MLKLANRIEDSEWGLSMHESDSGSAKLERTSEVEESNHARSDRPLHSGTA